MKEVSNKKTLDEIIKDADYRHVQIKGNISDVEIISNNDEDISEEQKELQKALKKTRFFKLRAQQRAKMREERLHAPHLVPKHAFEE